MRITDRARIKEKQGVAVRDDRYHIDISRSNYGQREQDGRWGMSKE